MVAVAEIMARHRLPRGVAVAVVVIPVAFVQLGALSSRRHHPHRSKRRRRRRPHLRLPFHRRGAKR